MDKYIEILTVYSLSWQQTALENIQFSAVLGGLAFLLGVCISSISKGLKIAQLNRQFLQEHKQAKEVESKYVELLNQQNINEDKITDILQQVEQAVINQEKQREAYQEELSSKESLWQQSIAESKEEIEKIKATLHTKTQLAEQLQNDLDGHKQQIAQSTELQNELLDIKEKHRQAESDLTAAQQQLDAELKQKDVLAQQLESQQQLADENLDKATQLEQELEKMRHSHQAEQPAPVPQQKQEVKTPQVEPVQQPLESSSAPIIEPEQEPVRDVVEQVQDSPIPTQQKTGKKGVKGKVSGWLSSRKGKAENTVEQDASNQEETIPADQQNTPQSAVAENVAAASAVKQAPDIVEPKADTKAETQQPSQAQSVQKTESVSAPVEENSKLDNTTVSGQAVGKKGGKGMVNWFNKLDDKLWIKKDFKQEESVADEQQADVSLETAQAVTEVEPEQIEAPTLATKPQAKKMPETKAYDFNEPDSGFSEKLVDFADKMDSYNGKLKGLFGSKKR